MARRLVAILAADVVGYSKLMADDDEGTLSALKKHRLDDFDPLVAEFSGRIVKLMGDGVLVEFPSVVSAVECAVAVQEKLVAGGGTIRLRMGINLGDVIIDGDDIYGDGVNVASRLESIADPDGICISDDVYRHVKVKIEAEFRNSGPRTLKNIPQPITVWRWSPGQKLPTHPTAGVALALPNKPSVAVMPFANMSDEPADEHFSDGISEDIITALSKLSKLFVVARNSTFTYKGRAVDVRQVGREQGVRYVLEGSVRRNANRVRITAQLVDATTGHHVWAHRYDRPMHDVFELQDEITREVTSALQVELTEGERARLWASGTKNLEAWEAAIQVPELLESHRRVDVLPARRLAERALALDQNYAAAWAMLGWSYWNEAFDGWSTDPDATLLLALDALERANSIDETNPDTLALLAFLHISLRKYEAARHFAEKAMLLGPNHCFAAGVAANVALFTNRPQEMVPLLQKAMRLCPIYPAWYVADLAHAYFLMDRHEDAITTAGDALKIDPDYIYTYYVLVAAHTELGDARQARNAALDILRIDPKWQISAFAKSQPFEDQRLLERFTASFQSAGLPE